VDIDGVRFLGTTLWTDYVLFVDEGYSVDEAMTAARSFMIDHTEIRLNRQPFAPIDTLLKHEAARAWLTDDLAVPFDGPTVVVTHHGMHRQSIHPRYAGDLVNASSQPTSVPCSTRPSCGSTARCTTHSTIASADHASSSIRGGMRSTDTP
jgi:hypothetical protein